MKFEQELKTGRLIKRYKRFLADISFDDGSESIGWLECNRQPAVPTAK